MIPPVRLYWYETHEETPCWWIFGVTWFWIDWRLCDLSKDDGTPFIGQYWTATYLMEIIHVDVYGPLYVAARGGFFYFMNFRRWFEWMGIYLMRKKSEKYLKWFKEFQHEVEIIVTRKIKYLWLDHRGEYLSYEFSKHHKSWGVVPQLMPRETP